MEMAEHNGMMVKRMTLEVTKDLMELESKRTGKLDKCGFVIFMSLSFKDFSRTKLVPWNGLRDHA